MDTDLTTMIWFIAARAVHFGSCLIIFSVCWFDRFTIPGQVRGESSVVVRFWEKIAAWLMALAIPMAAVSGAAWFAVVAMNMSGLPLNQALQPHVVRLVLHTRFGQLWQWRLVCWAAVALAACGVHFSSAKSRLRPAMTWLTFLLGAILLGSLAWSGHGQDGNRPQWHLLADVSHLISGSIWPTGLLPFGILLLLLRRSSADGRWSAVSKITSRFSAISLAAVAALVTTGFVNSCYMLRGFSDLFSTTYGRVLLTKIIFFLLAVALGAVNLILLKPRLAARPANIAAKLQITTALEVVLGTAAVVAVAVLGILPPG